jgi:hypothetical protein
MSKDRVDILSEVTDEVIATCYGPTPEGKCPIVNANAVVYCAGHRIAPTGGGIEYWRLRVPANSRDCPLMRNLDVEMT